MKLQKKLLGFYRGVPHNKLWGIIPQILIWGTLLYMIIVTPSFSAEKDKALDKYQVTDELQKFYKGKGSAIVDKLTAELRSELSELKYKYARLKSGQSLFRSGSILNVLLPNLTWSRSQP